MNPCPDYGPLISASLDGELDHAERKQLDAHLAECEACRQLGARFARTDGLVAVPANVSPVDLCENVQRRVRRQRRRRQLSAIVTYATAACILLGFAGSVLYLQKSDNHGVEVVDILEPLTTLQVVSRQEDRTYQSLRESLQWELRALRLEVRQLRLAPDQAAKLIQRIEILMRRIENPDIPPDKLDAGETI